MTNEPNPLEELEARAARGDRGALAELRHELEGRLVPLVRHALGGAGRPAFRQRVWATARQLARYAGEQPPDRERLARRIASCLSESLVDRLARAPSAGRGLQETVVA